MSAAMSEERVQESMWLLTRARGVGLLLRVLVLVSPLVSIGCTRLAASDTVPVLDVVVVALAVASALVPDSHVGLLVVLLVGGGWMATVDDPATPWSLAVAMSLTVFHAATAAACVAPPAARWTRAMCHRWTRRPVVLMAASACSWAAVVAIDRFDVGGSPLLLTASLLVLATVGLWVRDGSFSSGPRR